MSVRNYIIFNEKEGDQKEALASGNYSLVDVDHNNKDADEVFRQMKTAFEQESHGINIEVLE
jgi:hypothetical protein